MNTNLKQYFHFLLSISNRLFCSLDDLSSRKRSISLVSVASTCAFRYDRGQGRLSGSTTSHFTASCSACVRTRASTITVGLCKARLFSLLCERALLSTILAIPLTLGSRFEANTLVMSDLRASLAAHDIATILALVAVLLPRVLFVILFLFLALRLDLAFGSSSR